MRVGKYHNTGGSKLHQECFFKIDLLFELNLDYLFSQSMRLIYQVFGWGGGSQYHKKEMENLIKILMPVFSDL